MIANVLIRVKLTLLYMLYFRMITQLKYSNLLHTYNVNDNEVVLSTNSNRYSNKVPYKVLSTRNALGQAYNL